MVSTTGDGHDVAKILLFRYQGFAEEKDILAEIAFLYKAVGPDGTEQFFLREQPQGVLDQVEKEVKSLWRKCNLFTIAAERSLIRV